MGSCYKYVLDSCISDNELTFTVSYKKKVAITAPAPIPAIKPEDPPDPSNLNTDIK